MEQSGVKEIYLYNADSLSLNFVDANTIFLPDTPDFILTNLRRPNFKFTIEKRQRITKRYSYSIDFIEFLLSQTTILTLKSMTGFYPLVKFYNGNQFFYYTPFKIMKSEFNSNEKGVYEVNMQSEGFSEFRQLEQTQKPWILDTNYWDDDGIWKDEETWND